MKLIDMLVKETIGNGWSWPAGYNSIAQDEYHGDREGDIYAYINALSGGNYWFEDNDSGYGQLLFKGYEVAEDAATSLVTRQQYEAALAARNDGWIEWGGGECPVPCGTAVDVKHRCGAVSENQKAWPKHHKESDAMVSPLSNAGQAFWRHDNSSMDIIAYRLHKPKGAAQSKAGDESGMNECIEQCVSPIWNGEGAIPPVGCMCERSWSGDEWQPCKILFASNQLVVVKMKESGIEDAYSIGYVTFRPIRTEADKKREAAIKELTSVICGEIPDTGMATAAMYAARVYDAGYRK